MPNYLFDLEVDRVDLVDEGANSAAHIMFFKNKGGNEMDAQQIIGALKPEHKQVVEAYIEKAKEDAATEACKAKEKTDDTLKADLEAAKGEVEKAKTTISTLEAEVEDLKKSKVAKSNEVDFEEVLKGMDPAAAEVIKKMKADNEAHAIEVAKMKEEKATQEAVAKANTLKALPIEQTKLAEIIKKGIDADLLNALESIAQVCENSDLFKAKGTGATNADALDSWEAVDAKAAEIAKAKSVSIEKARAQILKENPDLYRTL